MKNMAALIDTNVLLNYITNREDEFLDSSIEIVEMCARETCIGYISFHTLPIVWYVLRKREQKERRQILLDLCKVFTVVSATQGEILKAIENEEFQDFEDCLQDKCAKEAGADFIVTCNVKDFDNSEIPAVTPREFIGMQRGEF